MKALDLKTKASYLMVIPIPAVPTKEISLPQTNSILEDALIHAIATYSVNELPKSPDKKTVVSAANLKQSFLTLRQKIGGVDNKQYIPLVDALRTAENGGFVERFDDTQIDIGQSKITVADESLLVAGEVFIIRFWYTPISDCK